MYLPKAFQESDPEALAAFVRVRPLATFVSTDASGGLCVDHFPMLLERRADGGQALRGHVARANPLWRNLGPGAQVLAVFQDAGTYVTPSWYATKAESGKVVPTWNYVAVHVQGRARAMDDSRWLRAFLQRLTDLQEASRQAPWKLTDAPADYIDLQLKAIVGIELDVERMQGKWKMSQNRLPRDIDGVIDGLRARGDPESLRMARDIETRRPR
jgi:transcriptional regulator